MNPDTLTLLAGFPIRPEYQEGVLAQWRLNQALATPLLAFDLPPETHPAPIFQP